MFRGLSDSETSSDDEAKPISHIGQNPTKLGKTVYIDNLNSNFRNQNPDILIQCPFNTEHKVSQKKFENHINKCGKNIEHLDAFVRCPYLDLQLTVI